MGSTRAPQQYVDYRSGRYTLSRNEIDQIGYRLAKLLDHDTVYPVDVDGEFPFERVRNFAKASGRTAELDRLMGTLQTRVRAQGAYLTEHTVLETLRQINSTDSIAQDQAFYAQTMRFGEAGDWAGADLAADWYRRNARIFSVIVQLIDSPRERVLVLYGAGHLGLLRQMVADDPTLRLRSLQEFNEP